MGDPGNENKEDSIPGLYLLAAQDIVNLLETVKKDYLYKSCVEASHN